MFTISSVESLIEENKQLKKENERLRNQVESSQNWTSIREGIIIPKALEMGAPRNIASNLATMLSPIIREFLDVRGVAEINSTNYEKAKNIATDIMEVLSKYEWKNAIRLRKEYEKKGWS
ncbi:hypothetical protein ACSW8Q_02455 [Clostridium perfringens]|uniref:hypothetical protein n=1 Tax=Clostridium perfringens TaxID=1502 RepID=UPI0013E3AD22|nr:hypothetical protein [Clostridium perfringens]NGT67497.1 hypothetical protein [Clostridium perfringens]